MKKIIKLTLSIQLIFLLILNQTLALTGEYNFNLSSETKEQVLNSPLATAIEVIIDGEIVRGYYAGIFNRLTDEPCSVNSDQCAFLFTDMIKLGPAKANTPSHRIIRPNEKTYTISTKDKSSTDNTEGQGIQSARENDPSIISENSQKNGSIQTGVPWFKDNQKIIAIGNTAIKSGIQSGIEGAVVIYLAKSNYDRAMKNVAQSQAQLNESLKQLNTTESELTNKIKGQLNKLNRHSMANYNLPLIQTTNISVNEPIDLENYRGVLSNSSSQYSKQAKSIAKKLNHNPQEYSATHRNIQKIGKAALVNSLDSRSVGDIEGSDAEMKIAQEMADLLYGLDPVTGLHRDLYELITGENLITGQKLTTTERALHGALAVLNMSTLGIVPSVGKSLKIATRLFEKLKPASPALFAGVERLTVKTSTILKKAGIVTKEKFKQFHEKVSEKVSRTTLKNEGDVEQIINETIKDSKPKLETFEKSFLKKPGSQESVDFIKNKVESYGLKAKNVYPGTSDEIYIIGRRMGNVTLEIPGVRTFRESLIKEGYAPEKIIIFEPSKDALRELKKTGLNYKDGVVPIDKLSDLKIWKENTSFMKSAIGKEGKVSPTLIELVRDESAPFSEFYDRLEIGMLNNSWRNK